MIDFNDTFNAYYDQFSIHSADFKIPAHFSVYQPDNQVDYQCLSVIAPDLNKGASQWTLGNSIYGQYQRDSWITIGVYRDEGRVAKQRPMVTGKSWSRTGFTITITDPTHKLHVGDQINTSNINVATMTRVTITRVDSTSFDFLGQAVGSTSGVGASYQMSDATSFFDNYLVFRLLPSFNLVPYSVIQQIFATTAPTTTPGLKTLYNITSKSSITVPTVTSSYTNYELPSKTIPPSASISLSRRFSQVYNESGSPLLLEYQANGYPKPVNNVDSAYKNTQAFYNLPVNPAGDSRIYVYDYYGLDINDPTRTPYSSSVIVSRNPNVQSTVNNFAFQADNAGNQIYSGTLNDLYGNLAIGVQSNNALVVRKQVLPIALDSFNRPIKGASA